MCAIGSSRSLRSKPGRFRSGGVPLLWGARMVALAEPRQLRIRSQAWLHGQGQRPSLRHPQRLPEERLTASNLASFPLRAHLHCSRGGRRRRLASDGRTVVGRCMATPRQVIDLHHCLEEVVLVVVLVMALVMPRWAWRSTDWIIQVVLLEGSGHRLREVLLFLWPAKTGALLCITSSAIPLLLAEGRFGMVAQTGACLRLVAQLEVSDGWLRQTWVVLSISVPQRNDVLLRQELRPVVVWVGAEPTLSSSDVRPHQGAWLVLAWIGAGPKL